MHTLQEAWGHAETHYMGDCKKYNSDGSPKKALQGKNVQHNLHNKRASHQQNASYAKLSAKITKLEKSNKKLKCTKEKHKRKYISDSNDLDSS